MSPCVQTGHHQTLAVTPMSPASAAVGKIPAAAATAIKCAAMEERKAHVHYNHTDHCSLSRWTVREAFQYMYARPWEKVVDYYSDLVRHGRGVSALSRLFPAIERHKPLDTARCSLDDEEIKVEVPAKEKTGRWERVTFKIVLSYHGGSFDGWQKQPDLNCVQGIIEKSLGRFVDENKAQQLKDRGLPLEGCALVAGRTDKGVTALQQVCSFYTWRKDVKSEELMSAINTAAPERIRALLISEVSRTFHPNFSAKWRRYFYIFPLDCEEHKVHGSQDNCSISVVRQDEHLKGHVEFDKNIRYLSVADGSEDDNTCHTGIKPNSFSVSKVDQLLRHLEGKSLSYRMFARDTKASRSIGPPTECFMFHARAAETELPCTEQVCTGTRVMCVELVANRFLRKMVRVLVATAIREAAAGADDDALIKLMDATCRRATAPPAPPDGLCLVDVGYDDFELENCLIF